MPPACRKDRACVTSQRSKRRKDRERCTEPRRSCARSSHFTNALGVKCLTELWRGSGYGRGGTWLLLEAAMAALAKMLSRASGFEIDTDTLRAILIFCGAGLLVSLTMLSYGIDLSPGFF